MHAWQLAPDCSNVEFHGPKFEKQVKVNGAELLPPANTCIEKIITFFQTYEQATCINIHDIPQTFLGYYTVNVIYVEVVRGLRIVYCNVMNRYVLHTEILNIHLGMQLGLKCLPQRLAVRSVNQVLDRHYQGMSRLANDIIY